MDVQYFVNVVRCLSLEGLEDGSWAAMAPLQW